MCPPRSRTPEEESYIQKERLKGRSYADIGRELGLATSAIWKICNRARHNVNNLESVNRYVKRGSVALCDLKDTP